MRREDGLEEDLKSYSCFSSMLPWENCYLPIHTYFIFLDYIHYYGEALVMLKKH